ncbi:hypothetical protein ABZV80_42250, partial [Streptomyces sp. NPDC005132]
GTNPRIGSNPYTTSKDVTFGFRRTAPSRGRQGWARAALLERMREGRKPWTFVASGNPFHEDLLVRTDAVSVEACLKTCLPQLRERGLIIPE